MQSVDFFNRDGWLDRCRRVFAGVFKFPMGYSCNLSKGGYGLVPSKCGMSVGYGLYCKNVSRTTKCMKLRNANDL